jgi:hypothetical protein
MSTRASAPTAWRPLITDPALVERAERIIDRSAAFFSTQRSRRPDDPRLAAFLHETSGSDGVLAVSLLFAYLHLDRGDSDTLEAAGDWLEHGVDLASSLAEPKPWLYAGVAGCGFCLDHLLPRLFAEPDGLLAQEDLNAELDATLIDFMAQQRGRIDPELVMGLSGLGTYFLERLPRPSAAIGLARVIEALAAQSEASEAGITWRKGLAALSDAHRERFPEGLYNLGIPHGVPGVVAFLARVCASEAASPLARELLEGSAAWLLAQELPVGASLYPYFSAPGRGPIADETRLAWCYGDLGIAAALLLAARALGRRDWEAAALRAAENAARRGEADSGVEDGMICHGAAGLAHLFNRLYQATGRPSLRRAAESWYLRTLSYHDPANGPTGYACFIRDPLDADTNEGRIIWSEAYGVAVGVTGISLVLLAGISRIAPDWDRLLAVEVAPSEARELADALTDEVRDAG